MAPRAASVSPGRLRRFAALGTLALIACGGGGTSTDDPGNGGGSTETMAKATPSGDQQQAEANTTLPAPFRVIITRSGAPVSGTTVTWQVTAGDGTVSPGTSITGGDGTAAAIGSLGSNGMTVSASADGVAGSPVSFTAAVIGPNAEVTVLNNQFNPQTVTIKAGGTVTFTWANGAQSHNVTPDDGKADPGSPDRPNLKSAPFSFTVRLTAPGDYYYHCTNHGSTRGGMFGKITVVP